MKTLAVCACCIAFLLGGLSPSVEAQATRATAGEEWDYVTVREGAHMFWWLYGINGTIDPSKPLIMWLQGGPGGSSTGFGNFEELGPLNVSLEKRPFPWTDVANVLFVDNPVGVGYSYVENSKLLTTNVEEIATDLVTLFRGFMQKMSQFETTPFYIFCESYGGKMTAAFGVALKEAIKAGHVKSDFHGVALGDSWISPIDSVRAWVTYLYSLSQIDTTQVTALNKYVEEIAQDMARGNYSEATNGWSRMEDAIEEMADMVDFYNVLVHHSNPPWPQQSLHKMFGNKLFARSFSRHVSRLQDDGLTALMNGPIKQKLGIIPEHVQWGGQSGLVFLYQKGDFMKDVVRDVEKLLSEHIEVNIYQGELDLIVPTTGTEVWLNTVTWPGMEHFKTAQRIPIYPPSGLKTRNTGAFVKKYENLAFYWIMKAGHMVPKDQGETALEMVRHILSHV